MASLSISARLVACTLLSSTAWIPAGEAILEYAPAPVANPLKGLVPYTGLSEGTGFPHSMEFSYLRFDEIVRGKGDYDWSTVEELLGITSGRGHQLVTRVYLEYPDRPVAVPDHLKDTALRQDGFPDYESPALRACLRDFIAAFGRRYDGDARIGFLTAGLLGKWGEWHTWPEGDRAPSKTVEAEILSAYAAAFEKTPVLLRYPYGPGQDTKAANAHLPFGYHDDSFAWGTLPGGEGDSWFYLPSLKNAGPDAESKWKEHPIGGEIRPEVWGLIFDEVPSHPQAQNFRDCVEQTHVSWLMDTGMFREVLATPARRERAKEEVMRMGYEFHVSSVRWGEEAGKLSIVATIENRGVAPFYYAWPIEWGLVDAGGRVALSESGTENLTRCPPGSRVAKNGSIETAGLPPGEYTLALRVPNPMPGGIPVRFANVDQRLDSDGWLPIGSILLRR